jgi:hypothetical protein
LIPKRWLAVLAVPTLAGFGYLWVMLWFAVHQRDFQYTPGGSRVAPERVGLDGFASVEIPTEDGERIVAWWAAPSSGGSVVLFLHGTPSTPLCCTDQQSGGSSHPHPLSCEANVLRPSKLQHAIQ